MDTAFDNLDAAGFLEIWQHFDADDNGYIEDKELDDFFRHMMKKLSPQEKVTEERVQRLKQRFMSAYDVTADGKLQIQELANMILPEDENFLLIFRREAAMDNSVDFMKIWRKYDVDCSGYISARELKMKIFDKNKDGSLDLNDLARILALEDNFLIQFQMESILTK
ncbi:hypothetical protein JOQ06_025785 [Pogonophryne albipinna]|uniref:EF-hand domain-containing protein n=1 Tax=Pogonophryne albipinna TaxID=1090488 RepID=A0AAD6FF80_9TELE|nr:hypothetical protein JOQ06_025785 [Pogonophryne albipinna]